jgi:hypothetical protein
MGSTEDLLYSISISQEECIPCPAMPYSCQLHYLFTEVGRKIRKECFRKESVSNSGGE